MDKKTKTAIMAHEYLRKKLMEELGLSVVEIAQRLHLSTVSVSKILNKRTSVSIPAALRVEAVFGIDAYNLMQMQWNCSFEEEREKITKSKEFKKLKKFELEK